MVELLPVAPPPLLLTAGELLSVRPGVMQMVKGLFVFNERVVLKGAWEHGFFAMTAIGATNVGSIEINVPDQACDARAPPPDEGFCARFFCVFDVCVVRGICSARPPVVTQPLTNSRSDRLTGVGRRYELVRANPKGSELGAFRLGSCIVLVFEAPETFEFRLRAGQAIRVGEALGSM